MSQSEYIIKSMKDDKLRNLFETISLLSRPEGATPMEVSDKLGYDRHTFYKMINTMHELNIPFDKTNDDQGATNSMRYFIKEKYLTSEGPKILRMTKEELFVLKYLLQKDSMFHDSEMAETITTLKEKLNKLTFTDTDTKPSTIYVTDNHRRNYNAVHQKYFSVITRAIEDHNPLEIEYTDSPDRQNNREVLKFNFHPYTLLDHNGAFYVLGLDIENEKMKVLNLERISNVVIDVKKTFEIPADFSPENYFKYSFGIGLEDEPVRVKLQFVWTAWTAIADRIWGENQKLTPQKDSYLLEFTTRPGIELESWIRSYGSDVEVVEPMWLRENIVKDLNVAMENYDWRAKQEKKNKQ